MRKRTLSPSALMKINQLFDNRLWDKSGARYENFCGTLHLLKSDKEKELMLELTKEFYILELGKLKECLFQSFYSLPDKLVASCQKIIFLPLKKTNASGHFAQRQKSGDIVFAMMERDCKWCDYAEKFVFCSNPASLPGLFDDRSLVCFVDDFIGSGSSAFDAYQTLKDFLQVSGHNLVPQQVVFLCACAMQRGKEYLSTLNLKVYCDILFKRAITDSYEEPLLSDHQTTMRTIENNAVKNVGIYSFGYQQSESLLTIGGKSPNNTFPIYWKTQSPIFPRY